MCPVQSVTYVSGRSQQLSGVFAQRVAFIATRLLLAFLFTSLSAAHAHSQERKFWDSPNKVLVPSYLALTASDAVATERLWRSGRGWSESNPLIPNSRAGRVAYFAGTAAAVLGASYLAHRTGHHKWERAILWIGTATEAQASASSWIRGPR